MMPLHSAFSAWVLRALFGSVVGYGYVMASSGALQRAQSAWVGAAGVGWSLVMGGGLRWIGVAVNDQGGGHHVYLIFGIGLADVSA
jgi:hypothetical protein